MESPNWEQLIAALAGTAVETQQEFDDVAAAYARAHELRREGMLEKGEALEKLLRPAVWQLAESRLELAFETEVRRTSEFSLEFQLLGRPISTFLSIVTESTETRSSRVQVCVEPVPIHPAMENRHA